MPLWDMTEPPEYPEPETFCDSCWWCDDIHDSRFGVVMYCHYHGEVYEDYEMCDDYDDAEVIARQKRNAQDDDKLWSQWRYYDEVLF